MSAPSDAFWLAVEDADRGCGRLAHLLAVLNHETGVDDGARARQRAAAALAQMPEVLAALRCLENEYLSLPGEEAP